MIVVEHSANIFQLQEKMMDALTAGKGIAGLITVLGHALKSKVAVVSADNRILATCGYPFQCGAYVNLNQYEREHTVLDIEASDNILGRMLVSIAQEAIDHDNQQLINTAVKLSAMELLKQHHITKSQQKNKDNFIFDLIYSNIDSKNTIIARGELWGWDFTKPHLAVVMELEDYEHFSEDRQLLDQLRDQLEMNLQALQKRPIVLHKIEEIITIIPLTSSGKREQKKLVEDLVKKIKDQFSVVSRQLHVGVGRIYDDPTNLFRSYQEAKVALQLGKIIEISDNAAYFSELGVVRILYNHNQQELLDFYRDNLGILEKLEQGQSRELSDTLQQYFKNNCDMKATAQELFLHANTLRYRLKKIEKILEIDLENLTTRLELMISFKIKELLKIKGIEDLEE